MVLKSFSCAAASTNIFFFLLGFLQRKVDEIARLSETRRKEQERNFRLVSLERGSSHRGTVVGALACHLVRVPVGTLYVGWVWGSSFYSAWVDVQKERGREFAREGEGRRSSLPLARTSRFSRVRRPLYFSLGKPATKAIFCSKRFFFPATHFFVLLGNQHCQILIQVSQISWGHRFLSSCNCQVSSILSK